MVSLIANLKDAVSLPRRGVLWAMECAARSACSLSVGCAPADSGCYVSFLRPRKCTVCWIMFESSRCLEPPFTVAEWWLFPRQEDLTRLMTDIDHRVFVVESEFLGQRQSVDNGNTDSCCNGGLVYNACRLKNGFSLQVPVAVPHGSLKPQTWTAWKSCRTHVPATVLRDS